MSKSSPYESSPWANLGHPAFENNINLINEDIEWWDLEEDDEYPSD